MNPIAPYLFGSLWASQMLRLTHSCGWRRGKFGRCSTERSIQPIIELSRPCNKLKRFDDEPDEAVGSSAKPARRFCAKDELCSFGKTMAASGMAPASRLEPSTMRLPFERSKQQVKRMNGGILWFPLWGPLIGWRGAEGRWMWLEKIQSN